MNQLRRLARWVWGLPWFVQLIGWPLYAVAAATLGVLWLIGQILREVREIIADGAGKFWEWLKKKATTKTGLVVIGMIFLAGVAKISVEDISLFLLFLAVGVYLMFFVLRLIFSAVFK